MKLGMFMHPIHDYRRGYHTLLNEDMDVIRCADAVGFDEVWLGEHFALPSEPIQSPLMLMAALIPETERIKLCTGVLCLPNQHPAIVAGQVAQFDHMAKGRFMFGIGPGAAPPDFEMFKVLDQDRMAMLEESIDMILGSGPPTRRTSSAEGTGTSRSGTRSFRTSGSAAWGSPTRTRTRPSCCPR